MKCRILLFLLLATAGLLDARPKLEPDKAVDTEQTVFASGGTVELKNSIGDLRIEGWDLAEVQVVVTKSAIERTNGELDRVVIETEQRSPDHLVIITKQPFRHRSDVQLSYVIRVPRQTQLVIAHNRGNVKVANVTANMRVSNRMGRIELSLPQNELYAIDAKAESGHIASDWRPEHCPGDAIEPLRLLLRVGTGDITLRRAPRG